MEPREKNREPILAMLKEIFAERKRVLEIAGSTGQHVVYVELHRRLAHSLYFLWNDPPNQSSEVIIQRAVFTEVDHRFQCNNRDQVDQSMTQFNSLFMSRIRSGTKMKKSPRILIAFLLGIMVVGCAAPRPLPFQLADSGSRIHQGTIFTGSQRIEVTVDGHLYSGFYIVASGSAVSQSLPGWRFIPRDTETTFFSNEARAHLTADNGQQLNCQFLIESGHAVGECRSPAGAVFQLFTGTSGRSE
jgi:Protein of unknown function (DUF938)